MTEGVTGSMSGGAGLTGRFRAWHRNNATKTTLALWLQRESGCADNNLAQPSRRTGPVLLSCPHPKPPTKPSLKCEHLRTTHQPTWTPRKDYERKTGWDFAPYALKFSLETSKLSAALRCHSLESGSKSQRKRIFERQIFPLCQRIP